MSSRWSWTELENADQIGLPLPGKQLTDREKHSVVRRNPECRPDVVAGIAGAGRAPNRSDRHRSERSSGRNARRRCRNDGSTPRSHLRQSRRASRLSGEQGTTWPSLPAPASCAERAVPNPTVINTGRAGRSGPAHRASLQPLRIAVDEDDIRRKCREAVSQVRRVERGPLRRCPSRREGTRGESRAGFRPIHFAPEALRPHRPTDHGPTRRAL